jgi:two-component system, cell cycle sensor histidine kinase and response regulator CckA
VKLRPASGAAARAPQRWIPTAVLVLGLAAVVLLVTVERLSDQWSSRDLQTLHAVADVANAATSVHLLLRDLAEGEDVDLGRLTDDMSAARQLARGLVEGSEPGLTRRGLEPVGDSGLADRLVELRHLVERFALLARDELERAEAGRTLAPGSPNLREHDRVFNLLEDSAAALQIDLANRIRANKRRSQWIIGAILAGWLVLIAGAAATLWNHEKHRARAEEALREREGQLLQAQKMEAVGRLAGGIAHDINNYLAAIRGQCELVKMKAAADDPTQRRMDLVLTTADRASSLIQRLLSFSRRQPMESRVVDLNTVVGELEPMMERLIGDDLRLTMRPCRQSCPVLLDPAQIEQVVVNLLVNARDAMPTGGEVRLTCSCRTLAEDDPGRPATLPPGDYVELRVEDTGVGIPGDELDRIFEPFYTTKSEASGLGLPTVYGIVTQSGGAIEVDSEPGGGAVFSILLPRHREAAADGAVPAARAAAKGDVPAGRGERLLLVDDHDEFRESVRDLLEGLGYHVEVAANVETAEGLFAAGGEPFDLVVTDVVMPGANGRQLMDRLRRRHGGVRGLYVSGYTGDVTLRHGVHDRSLDLLQKPFPFEVLARKVREVLDRPDARA